MEYESFWRRAWRDTEICRRKNFYILSEMVIILVTGFCGTCLVVIYTLPITKPSFLQQYLYPSAGSLFGAIVGLLILNIGTFLWNLFKAPYRINEQLFDIIGHQEQVISEMQIGKPLSEKDALVQGFEKLNQGFDLIATEMKKLSSPNGDQDFIEEKAEGITTTADGKFSYIVPIENASSMNLGFLSNGKKIIEGLCFSIDCPDIIPIPNLGCVMVKFNRLGKNTYEVALMTHIEKPSPMPFSFAFYLEGKVSVTQQIPARSRGCFREKSESFILNEKDLPYVSPLIVIYKHTIP